MKIYLDKPIKIGSLVATSFECDSYTISTDKLFISFDTEIKSFHHRAHYYIPLANVIAIESKHSDDLNNFMRFELSDKTSEMEEILKKEAAYAEEAFDSVE